MPTSEGRAHLPRGHFLTRPRYRVVGRSSLANSDACSSPACQGGIKTCAGNSDQEGSHDDYRREHIHHHLGDHHGEDHHHEDHHHDHHRHDHHDLSGHVENGCCHTHFETDPRWGPIRQFLFNAVRWLGIFRYSDSMSHSLPAAVGSGLLLASSFAIQMLRPDSILGQWQTISSAAATLTMAASLAISATPAFADAFYKVQCPCFMHRSMLSSHDELVARALEALTVAPPVQVLQAEVDTHALMALAGAGSFILGFPLEGALLFSLFHLAHVLEGLFVDRANSDLSLLVDSLPKTIRTVSATADGLVDWASQQQASVDDVAIGRLIVVKPGELVPLDGVIFSGTALLGTPAAHSPIASTV